MHKCMCAYMSVRVHDLRVDREHVGNTLTASTGRQVCACMCFFVCLFVSMGAYLKNRYREQHLLFPKK